MTKKHYYSILSVAFLFAAVQCIYGYFTYKDLLVSPWNYRLLLMLFIIRMEGKFVEKLPFKILIYASMIVLIIGVLLKITHWQFDFISGSLLIPVTAAMLLVSLVLAAIIEQNKNVLHYLLFLFVGFILFLVEYPFEILTWWIYLVMVIFLGLISLLYAIKA